MPKDIVVCCDGTGNEIGTNISNVLKLFRVLEKSDEQRVYYHPGVGTIGLQSTWRRFKQEVRGVFSLATGAGLDKDVLAGYCFLCKNYQEGDRVFLFGFSRGAYTVRVLAGFIYVMGLLPRDQLDLAGYAFAAYKRASSDSQRSGDGPGDSKLREAWHFRQIAGGRLIQIEFIGVWDTVASVIVPRQDDLLFDMQMLRFTRTNNSVKKFRQAMSIDERRRMFRLNRWKEPQGYRSNRFDPATENAAGYPPGLVRRRPRRCRRRLSGSRKRPFEIPAAVDDRAGARRRAAHGPDDDRSSGLGPAQADQQPQLCSSRRDGPDACFAEGRVVDSRISAEAGEMEGMAKAQILPRFLFAARRTAADPGRRHHPSVGRSSGRPRTRPIGRSTCPPSTRSKSMAPPPAPSAAVA